MVSRPESSESASESSRGSDAAGGLGEALREFRSGRPSAEEYGHLVQALRETPLFVEERVRRTRALVERIGQGEYTLDDIGER